jgi:hypothetical protein
LKAKATINKAAALAMKKHSKGRTVASFEFPNPSFIKLIPAQTRFAWSPLKP